MKRIGAGWQYVVYDLGNGKVLKKQRPRLEQVFFAGFGLAVTNISSVWTLPAELRRIDVDTHESASLVQKLLPAIDPALLGNPVFLDAVAFEQDRVEPLHAYLKRAMFDDQREAFDGYAGLVELLWEYGIGETTFNFSLNNGRTSDGRIIQIDLGELTDSKERVLNEADSGRWRTQYSFLSLKEPLRAYAFERMEQTMTRENVEKHWGVRI